MRISKFLKKHFWSVVLLAITILNIFIPDPLPIFDEIILIYWSSTRLKKIWKDIKKLELRW